MDSVQTIDHETLKFNEIFIPGLVEETLQIANREMRFAYYTSAQTAMKIIENSELWFRNASVMNDFSEVRYGLNLIQRTFSGPLGARFRETVDDIFDGTVTQVEHLLSDWIADWESETYIACVSVHDASEDSSGRLSMWRAYGDTALVVKNTPMMAVTDKLGVYSMPVMYKSQEQYETHLSRVTDSILINRRYLMELGQEKLVSFINHMFFHTAIATKHPGFAEEKEWRLYYRPNEEKSSLMEPRTVVLNGSPQVVYVLPLRHDPDNGLYHADLPSLLDRLIIGPTEFPYVSTQAFRAALTKAGVEVVDRKVIASDIPLRIR